MAYILRRILRGLYEVVEMFVISASIFVVVYLFLAQPHRVQGNSMYPTFHDKEYVLTDKVTFRRRLPVYGDVIVFKAPVNENFDFIKRVIGEAGDTVMVEGGMIYRNGQALDEFYLPDEYTTSAGQFLREGVPFTVPQGTIFAIGDNRDHSSDSRDWGPVPLENIVGRTFIRYWPVDTFEVIKNPVK